jgi:hypothetical protein
MASDELAMVAAAAANTCKRATAVPGAAPAVSSAAEAAARPGSALAPQPEWIARFHEELAPRLAQLQPDDVSHILCACASLPVPPPGAFTAAALAALLQRMQHASMLSLGLSLRAAHKLGHPPDKEWQGALLMTTHRAAASGRMPLPALLQLLRGMVDLHAAPGGLLAGRYRIRAALHASPAMRSRASCLPA